MERGRDGAGSDLACAIGHVVGHLKDVGKACARDRAAGVGVLLLLGDGAIHVESDGVLLLVGGASDRNRLGVDAGVEPDEHVRVWRSMALAWAAMRAAYLWRTTRSLSAWWALTCVAVSAIILLIRWWCAWCVWFAWRDRFYTGQCFTLVWLFTVTDRVVAWTCASAQRL